MSIQFREFKDLFQQLISTLIKSDHGDVAENLEHLLVVECPTCGRLSSDAVRLLGYMSGLTVVALGPTTRSLMNGSCAHCGGGILEVTFSPPGGDRKPDATSSASTAKPPKSRGRAQAKSLANSDGDLVVTCECGAKFRAQSSDIGRDAICVRCEKSFVIPSPGGRVVSAPESMSPPTPTVHEVPCPECNGKLEVHIEHVGRKGRCHHCGQVFRVPDPQFHAGARQRGKPKKEETVTAHCPDCYATIEVPESKVESRIVCRICGSPCSV